MNTTANPNNPRAVLEVEELRKLCGGREPHCIDWKREMLPDGYRPLTAGEEIQNGIDEIYYEFATPKWHKCNSPESTPATSTMQHRRTKRPIEFRIDPAPEPTTSQDPQTPPHYSGPVTPWDLEKCMQSSGSAFVDSRRTDAIEYCFRLKGDLIGDLRKARHCLDEAIKVLESQSPATH